LVANVVFIALFYKELKLATFDGELAAALGFSPVLLHYGLMGLVSVTAVGAFDVVGSILVVALMIAPPSAAYLLTDRLSRMLFYSGGMGALAAVGGYGLARALDANIAGSMAAVAGFIFLLAWTFAPQRGLISMAIRRSQQRITFAQTMLTIHLLNHEGTERAAVENRVDHLWEHLRWQPAFAEQVVRFAERKGMVRRQQGHLLLTDEGRGLAKGAMMQ
jgi:manganese/zinc/iron transport system permease protein